MQQSKDNFSAQADAYFKFRPTYPQALYTFLFNLPGERKAAWDSGTGNGQVAAVLAGEFEQVFATDISKAQLQKATQKKNIRYAESRAEASGLPSHSIDLVTVAQAIHWFDHDAFYKEVRRVANPGAWVAAWGYGLLDISPELNPVVADFYHNTVGPYWDGERRHIDLAYREIPFPFKEVKVPGFSMRVSWTRGQFMGYLSSWSSVQHYMRQRLSSPNPPLEKQDAR